MATIKEQSPEPQIEKAPSIPTLRRLPIYYVYLQKLRNEHVESVSCTQIAQALNLVPIQVRKDLAMTASVGKPRVGYQVTELLRAIENFLGWNNVAEAFLVGAGHLGSALLGYNGFSTYGLHIVAAFDISPAKIGTKINGKQILALHKMPEMVRRMGIKIGILTSPGEAAQALADQMVAAGIRAIWNFAPARIQVPSHIIVQHENLASSLAVLSTQLRNALHLSPPK